MIGGVSRYLFAPDQRDHAAVAKCQRVHPGASRKLPSHRSHRRRVWPIPGLVDFHQDGGGFGV